MSRGLPLDHKPSKVLTLKGTKKVHCRTSGNKTQITVLAYANAAGNVIPPMIIFDFEGKRLNPEWTKGEVPNTLYGMSDKGWTDMELFIHWMKDLFLPNIPPTRPVLLLLDGHSSHYEPDTISLAAEEGVIIICLPPPPPPPTHTHNSCLTAIGYQLFSIPQGVLVRSLPCKITLVV